MKIFYFVRSLDGVPSCMYNIQMLQDCGYEVIVVSGKSTQTLNQIMDTRGIQYFDGNAQRINGKKLIDRIKNKWNCTRQYKRCVKQSLRLWKKNDILILGTADSALPLRHMIKKYRYILSLKELHEKPFWHPFFLKKIARHAVAVICCEVNRARILKFRWKLDKRPYVISNKPYGYPTQRMMKGTTESNKLSIEEMHRHKYTIVYQARHIHFAYELTQLAKALNQVNEDCLLVLIGEVDNLKDKEHINELYSNTLWTGHIMSPLHLEITSNAYIGVAVYAENSLNNMFCAPNKTFEYAAFGIPTLCNSVPGLVETIGIKKAGICVDWDNVEAIAKSIKMLIEDYSIYSENAKVFYKAEDNLAAIDSLIRKECN